MKFGKQVTQQPDGRIRRSQAVTTFGPGSMVDLLDQAVLIGGLDFWGYDSHAEPPAITETRLREVIADRLRAIGVELSEDQPFLKPPAGNERDPSKMVGIQVLEFPQWFVCQGCRVLTRRDGLEKRANRYRHQCTSTRASETVPVRFVGACKRGHLEDFPWIAFSHMKSPRCSAPSLRLDEGATGDFSEIQVSCACGANNKLSAAMHKDIALDCSGHRPWLGSEGSEKCEEKLRLLVRTASNSYFAQVVSALSVPEPGRELEEKVRSVWDVLKIATPELMPAFRAIPKVQLALEGHNDDKEVLAVITALQKGTAAARLPLRTAEFQQFLAAPPAKPGDLPPENAKFFARSFKPKKGLPDGVGKLVLASKLREVTAQIGLTRIEPITPDLQGEFDLGVKSTRLGLTTGFLPATEIRGEGVFLALDEDAVREWETRTEVVKRKKQLEAGFNDWAKTTENPQIFPGVRFYLLHSLSHLLITAMSLECGYAASSIRERIYCGPSPADPTPMAAILISTGTSGSEGTLGGLVEEGRKIREHLQRAYDLGRLCSNDPVCAAHSPQEDHAERFLEGAACHGCLFIAECSCERFNRYLDRALVVPTVGRDAELAFFRKRP